MLRYSIISAVLTLLGYLALIPALGLIGAGFTQLTAALLLNWVVLVAARSRLGIVWTSPRYRTWGSQFFVVLVLLLTIRAVALPQDSGQIATALVLGFALLGAYVVALVAAISGGLNDDERSLIAAIGRKLGLSLHQTKGGFRK